MTKTTSASTGPYPRLVLIRKGEEFAQERTRTSKGYKRAGYKYVRVGDHVEYYSERKGEGASSPVRGYRSILRLELDDGSAVVYDAIERANGFTHLAEGVYERMCMLPRHRHPIAQEFHVHGQIFIHAADYPEFLDGCIAPGKSQTDGGVADSKLALKEIIEGLGGWRAGRNIRLEVRGSKLNAGA